MAYNRIIKQQIFQLIKAIVEIWVKTLVTMNLAVESVHKMLVYKALIIIAIIFNNNNPKNQVLFKCLQLKQELVQIIKDLKLIRIIMR